MINKLRKKIDELNSKLKYWTEVKEQQLWLDALIEIEKALEGYQ